MRHIPFLAIIVIAYNILAFSVGDVLSKTVWDMRLVSGAQLQFTVNDLLLCAAVILLYVELLKATRTSGASVFDHILSLAIFIICLVEFLLLSRFGNSVFLVITLITLLDVVAGFTITISTARRDFGFGQHSGS